MDFSTAQGSVARTPRGVGGRRALSSVEVEAHDVVREAERSHLRLIRFLWCGSDGTVRGTASGLTGLLGRLEHGIGVPVALQATNVRIGLQSQLSHGTHAVDPLELAVGGPALRSADC
jgi:hypothetical protein